MLLYLCSVPVRIYFTPNSEKEVNFNLTCRVKRKTTPLMLNVKAEGYSMNCLVLCEDSVGNKIEFSGRAINEINFGEVRLLFVTCFVSKKNSCFLGLYVVNYLPGCVD